MELTVKTVVCMKERSEDKKYLGEIFELGQNLGRGVQLQYKVLLPLSNYFDGRYKEQGPYLKDGILGWLDKILDKLEQFSLTGTNGFKEIRGVENRINTESITLEESLKFDDQLINWCREFVSSFSGQSSGQSKSDGRSVWFKIGFFSQYLLVKMRLYDEISQRKGTNEIGLGSSRKELVDAIEKEVFVTGWLDQDWVRKINKMRLPYDSRVLDSFISDSRELLDLDEERGADLSVKLKDLLKNVPFIGPRI